MKPNTLRNRMLSLLLALALLFAFSACKPGGGTPAPSPTVEIAVQPLATATQAPTPTPMPTASERFAALDKAIFVYYVTQDGYTFHQKVANPADYGIDPATVPMTLGEFSEESTQETVAVFQGYLTDLNAIPRGELTEQEQLSYDVLQTLLEKNIEDGKFSYYYEPLENYVGAHTNLPLSFALYDIDTEEDVKNYLTLLQDFPRYFGQILEYEKNRAIEKRFMTVSALDSVISDCNDIINARDTMFLIGTFEAALAKVEGISEEQRAAYRATNEKLVKEDFVDAYVTMRDGLEALRSFCRTEQGVGTAFGQEGRDYFALRMIDESSIDCTVAEGLALLESALYSVVTSIQGIIQQNPGVLTTPVTVTTGDTMQDIAYAKTVGETLIGELPAHELVVTDIPKELESQLSGAAYVIPPVDDAYRNEVLINRSVKDDTALFTTAHESYPGHLYQHVYQSAIPEISLTQRALSFSGYAEGWANMAEELFIQGQTDYSQDFCMVSMYDSYLTNVLLPAIISIAVNYYDFDLAKVQSYLTSIGLSDPAYAALYFDYALNMPYYTFSYAMGYAKLSEMMTDAVTTMGTSRFDQKAYLNQYLSLGPGYYNLLAERMDVWVDAQMADS